MNRLNFILDKAKPKIKNTNNVLLPFGHSIIKFYASEHLEIGEFVIMDSNGFVRAAGKGETPFGIALNKPESGKVLVKI